MGLAVEISIVPYPESMQGIFDFILSLNCITHRRFVDGIGLTRS